MSFQWFEREAYLQNYKRNLVQIVASLIIHKLYVGSFCHNKYEQITVKLITFNQMKVREEPSRTNRSFCENRFLLFGKYSMINIL